MTDAIALLCLLVGLELVLGVDNILVIAIFVGRLPESRQNSARILGLALAFLARVLMLLIVLVLAHLTRPVFMHFSVRDGILLAGGLFLIWKAVTEIHHTLTLGDEKRDAEKPVSPKYWTSIAQIVLFDIVFSIDSVITAVGLTDRLWIIIVSVFLAFLAVLAYARPIGNFILRYPALKILALSFLITIGVTIFMEGLHKHVPKAYIYLPMGFALFVELLQMRYKHNRKKMGPLRGARLTRA